jgi:hypothetical protein
MENKTHWKKLINHNFINEGDLDGGNIIATIKSVALEPVTSPTGKTDDMHILRFAESDIKPMILSAKQNFKNIESATGSPYVENWTGKQITIYYDPKVKFGSAVVGGVRIKPVAPVVKLPELTKSHPAFAKAVEKLKSGDATIDTIKKHFSITAELESELKNI